MNFLTRDIITSTTPPQVDADGNPKPARAHVKREKLRKGPMLALENVNAKT